MLDLIGTERNVFLSIISLLLLMVSFYFAYKAKNYPSRRRKNIRSCLFFLWIFSIFSFWGTDWFHLLLQYPEMLHGGKISVEPFYVWISRHLAYDYLGFRAIVWGGGVWTLSRLFRKVQLPYETTLYYFFIFCALCFSYSRQSVCTIVMLYGAFVYVDYKQSHRTSYLFLAFFLIWSAIYLHKSSPFLLACLLLSFLSINISGRIVLLPFLILPFTPGIVSEFLSTYLQDDIVIDNQYLQNSLTVSVYYLEDEKEPIGIFGMFLIVVEYLVYYAVALLAILLHKAALYKKLPYIIKLSAKLQIIVVAISSIFLFDLGATTDEMAHRFIMYSFLPSALIVAYTSHSKYYLLVTRIAYILALFNMIGNSIYPVYADLINHKY